MLVYFSIFISFQSPNKKRTEGHIPMFLFNDSRVTSFIEVCLFNNYYIMEYLDGTYIVIIVLHGMLYYVLH